MGGYSCNDIDKSGKRAYICNLELGHQGKHVDGDYSWSYRNFDDDDEGLPPIW